MISSLFFLTEDGDSIAQLNFTEKVSGNDLLKLWGEPLYFPVGSEGSLRCATRVLSNAQRDDGCGSGKSVRMMIGAASAGTLEADKIHVYNAVGNPDSMMISSCYFSTFIRRQNIIVAATMHEEVLSSAVISLLDHIVNAISVFLQGFNENVLRENFSTVHQLLHEMLDCGYPLLRYDHEFASAVAKPTLEHKIRQLMDVSGPQNEEMMRGGGEEGDARYSTRAENGRNGGGSLVYANRGDHSISTGGRLLPLAARQDHQTVTPIVPWRSAKKGTSNYFPNSELLFDVIERIDCVMDNDGNVVYSAIRGAIEVNAKLTSNESEVLVRIDHPDAMRDVGLHYSVRVGLYESQRVFSFIPPDGKFTLCQYTALPPVSPLGTTNTGATHASLIPFYVTPRSFLLPRHEIVTSEDRGKNECRQLLHPTSAQPQEAGERWNDGGLWCASRGQQGLEKVEVEGSVRGALGEDYHLSLQAPKKGTFSCLVGWRGGGIPLDGPNEVRDIVIRLRFSRRVLSIHVESCNRGQYHVALHANELHWHIDRLESTAPYISGLFTLADEHGEEGSEEGSKLRESWKEWNHDMGERIGPTRTSSVTLGETFTTASSTTSSSPPTLTAEDGAFKSSSTFPPSFFLMDPEWGGTSPRPPLPIGISAQIDFSIMNYSPSKIKIASVQIGGRGSAGGRGRELSFYPSGSSETKLFKGVKYATKAGNFLIRSTS